MSMRDRHAAVYVISVAAELAGMHPQTLRIYERRGLVEPARTKGGNRRYSEADIELLSRIAELTEQGLNLEGIRRVMELENQVAQLEQEVASLRASQASSRRDLVPLGQALAVFSRRSESADAPSKGRG